MLAARLAYLRKQLDKTQDELADFLGITRPGYTAYESGRRQPDYKALRKLADYFNVSLDYLTGATDNPRPVNELAKQITASALSETTLPRLGTIHAGLPILAEENWDGDIDAPVEWRGEFALHVEGDSMSWAGIHGGDTAILRQTDEAQHGMIVAAGIEDMEWTATLKFYIRENGQAYLRAANPAYEDIPIGPGHRIVGQLVGVLKEPPSLQQYREHMASKDVSDCQWLNTIETATGLGLSGDEVRHMINLFAKVSRSGGRTD